MTDVVVLAAGLGTRLAAVTSLPKWLTPVGDSSPASAQLAALAAANVGRVHVVVPPTSQEVDAVCRAQVDALDIVLVRNERQDLNNWHSLELGFESCLGSGDGGVIVLNSDLFASAAWFHSLVGALTASVDPAALAVDRERALSDEAMKVQVEHERVCAIGKVGMSAPGGEYVGASWWSRQGAFELHDILRGFADDPTQHNNWYEHAIQVHLQSGAHYAAVDVPTSRWVEIDDEADLAAARRLQT